jgi:hypothetical protein
VSSFLVVSHKHELLPFANRLMNEGHKVYVIIWRSKYERAWSGRIEPVLKFSRDSIRKETWGPYVEKVKSGELIVVSNVPKVREIFEGHGYHWSALDQRLTEPFRCGGWFTGEEILNPHLVIADVGAWPGGLGSRVDGGLVLVRLPKVPEILEEPLQITKDKLKSDGYHGLFSIEFERITGTLRLKAVHGGWLPLHLHAFLAEVPLSPLLLGQKPKALPRFVVALPLTLPPWPVADAHYPVDQDLKGLTQTQMGRVWWHDVRFSQQEKAIRTAGLDGLLGIVVAAAHNLELARGRVLEVARRLQVPELQYRPDVGAAIPTVLAGAEETLGLEL